MPWPMCVLCVLHVDIRWVLAGDNQRAGIKSIAVFIRDARHTTKAWEYLGRRSRLFKFGTQTAIN